MALFSPSELSEVLDAANFKALTNDNFETLARLTAKREATYSSGVPTTIVGPPTSGTHVLKEFWRDGANGEWVCTVAGTPGTWAQVKDAYVSANPTTTVTGYLITRTDLGGERYYWDGAAWQAVNATAAQLAAFPWRQTVRVALTTNLTLSGTQTIDGIACIAGDRVAAIGQTTAADRGIYVVAAGAWSRATDADASAEVKCGMAFRVEEGTVGAGKLYYLSTANPITLGVTSLTFAEQQATATFSNQSANLVFGGPASGGAAAPGFRALVAADIPANDRKLGLQFVIDGGGVAITTGIKGYLEVPAGFTITQVTLLADQSGSIVVDLWKDTYGNFPPLVGDTITASAKPTISAAVKSQDATLTGWTTACAAGDIIAINVDSASTVTRVTLSLIGTKT